MKKLSIIMFCLIFLFPVICSGIEIDTKLTENKIKHYDPSHPGHFHKCANCKKLYHQAGDEYYGSQGSNICPYCGYSNIIPPSTNIPEPPVQPPVYPNPGNLTADQIISHANSAFTDTEADSILYDGARRINDAMGIIKISSFAHSETTIRNILNLLDKNVPFTNHPGGSFIERYYSRFASNQMGDEMIMHSHRFVTSVRDLLRLSVKVYYSTNAYTILQRVENKENVSSHVYINDVRDCFYGAGSFEVGDRMLVAVMKYFVSKNDLIVLSQMAHYQNTKTAINIYASGLYRSNREIFTNIYRISSENSEIELDKKDINMSSIDRIRKFINRYEQKRIKKSPRLFKRLDEVKNFLKKEYLRKPQNELLQLIDKIE